MIKRIFGVFMTWFAMAFGYHTGKKVFNALTDPIKKTKIKKKFKKIKDAILSKD